MNINEQIKIIEEIRTLLDENGIIPAKWHHKLIDEFIETKVKNNVDLADVSGSFNHETISKIRNSQSDAEARRIIATHIKNYR
jgi:hypothetical protein